MRQTRSRQLDPKCRLKSTQYTLIIPRGVIQLTTMSFWVPETRLLLPQVNKLKFKKIPPKRVKYLATPSSIFLYFFLIHRRALCSQPVRDKIRRTLRMFPEHVERSFLDPKYSFAAVRRILRTIFAKQKFAQLRTNYIRKILATHVRPIKNGIKISLLILFVL